MRNFRIEKSNERIDELEHKWWNDNAITIEKIWAQNFDIQQVIRLHYLSKMKDFFLKGEKKRPIRILEIGCGSGWVCRLIADQNIHVIGTDFSEGQLDIAKKMANQFKKSDFCSYELADAKTFQKDVDGVVIHALLHHLTEVELNTFFKEFSNLSSGTKVFIYEPVFLNRQSGKTGLWDKVINKLIYNLKKYAINRSERKGEKDIQLNHAMEKIDSDAKENGWYISPKEIPFKEGELENYLAADFTILKKYIVNKSELDIAQSLTMNSIEKPGFLFSKILIPLSRGLDNLSFKGKFTHFLYPNQHLFICFEIIKK